MTCSTHMRDTQTSSGSLLGRRGESSRDEWNDNGVLFASCPFLYSALCVLRTHYRSPVSTRVYRRMFYALQTDLKVHTQGNWIIDNQPWLFRAIVNLHKSACVFSSTHARCYLDYERVDTMDVSAIDIHRGKKLPWLIVQLNYYPFHWNM